VSRQRFDKDGNCICGCHAIPQSEWGGMCIHCGHDYRRQSARSFQKEEHEHLSRCPNFRKYATQRSRKKRAKVDELARQRDACSPGSKEEKAATGRLLKALFG
jgi:hypothetical protein